MTEGSKACLDQKQAWILQFCHGYDGPFLDCARQYAALFENTSYKVCTVYLTGVPNDAVAKGSNSDEVIFLDFKNYEIRGLKFRAISEFRKISNSRDFLFCITHRFKPTYIALFASSLCVISVQHAFNVYQRFSRRLFARIFQRRLSILGVSNAVRDNIRKYLPSFSEASIQTLYNRADTSLKEINLSREQARLELGLPADSWIVGNVGRLHPDKDQSTLIKGFAKSLSRLPLDAKLVIMGVGRLEASLIKLSVELGIQDRVLFLGQIPCAKRYFKAFDVFALTSDSEPFGMVLLEAMAAGVPIICSDCGGGREVVSGNGRLFPFSDDEALADCLAEYAGLTNAAKTVIVDAAYERLESEFSDEVARGVFFHHLEGFKRNWS